MTDNNNELINLLFGNMGNGCGQVFNVANSTGNEIETAKPKNLNPPPLTVELPAAPQNASPVPHLTSIHSSRERGPYGCSSYRGNCGGLLQFFDTKHVLDPRVEAEPVSMSAGHMVSVATLWILAMGKMQQTRTAIPVKHRLFSSG